MNLADVKMYELGLQNFLYSRCISTIASTYPESELCTYVRRYLEYITQEELRNKIFEPLIDFMVKRICNERITFPQWELFPVLDFDSKNTGGILKTFHRCIAFNVMKRLVYEHTPFVTFVDYKEKKMNKLLNDILDYSYILDNQETFEYVSEVFLQYTKLNPALDFMVRMVPVTVNREPVYIHVRN